MMLIIVDYRLPGMDGLEFMSKIRNSHPNAVKLLVTAYGSREVLGVQGFINKPFTIDTIQDALSRLIRKDEKQEK
jgi:CheY-like chemotaxis protein